MYEESYVNVKDEPRLTLTFRRDQGTWARPFINCLNFILRENGNPPLMIETYRVEVRVVNVTTAFKGGKNIVYLLHMTLLGLTCCP